MGSVGNLKGLFALANFLKPWDWLFLIDEEGRKLGRFARVLGGGSIKIRGLKRILVGIFS